MSDHGLRYLNKKKKKIQLTTPVLNPTVFKALVAADIKTNIRGKSLVINKNGKGQHINLKNVKTWRLEGNSLIIRTVDNDISIILNFISFTEASLGEIRFTNIFNGALL